MFMFTGLVFAYCLLTYIETLLFHSKKEKGKPCCLVWSIYDDDNSFDYCRLGDAVYES